MHDLDKFSVPFDPNSNHQLHWTPDNYGKGIIDALGRLHHWNVRDGEDGYPSHYQYRQTLVNHHGQSEYALKQDQAEFWIDPDGYARLWNGEAHNPAFAVDPRLKPEPQDTTWGFEGAIEPSTGKTAATLGELAQHAYQRVQEYGGCTLGLNGQEPNQGFAYSPYPELEKVVPTAQLHPDIIQHYLDDTAEALTQPQNYLGVWTEGANTFLDVSHVSFDPDEAIKEAIKANQISVINLATNDVISTGVTPDREVTSNWDEFNTNYPVTHPEEGHRLNWSPGNYGKGSVSQGAYGPEFHTWNVTDESDGYPWHSSYEGALGLSNGAKRFRINPGGEYVSYPSLGGQAGYNLNSDEQEMLHHYEPRIKMADDHWNFESRQLDTNEDDTKLSSLYIHGRGKTAQPANFHNWNLRKTARLDPSREEWRNNWRAVMGDTNLPKVRDWGNDKVEGMNHGTDDRPWIYEPNSHTIHLGPTNAYHWDFARHIGFGDMNGEWAGWPTGRLNEFEGPPALKPYLDEYFKNKYKAFEPENGWNFSANTHRWMPDNGTYRYIVNNEQLHSWPADEANHRAYAQAQGIMPLWNAQDYGYIHPNGVVRSAYMKTRNPITRFDPRLQDNRKSLGWDFTGNTQFDPALHTWNPIEGLGDDDVTHRYMVIGGQLHSWPVFNDTHYGYAVSHGLEDDYHSEALGYIHGDGMYQPHTWAGKPHFPLEQIDPRLFPEKSEFTFGKVAAVNYTPGRRHKGMIINGEVHMWPVNEDAEPHHQDMYDTHDRSGRELNGGNSYTYTQPFTVDEQGLAAPVMNTLLPPGLAQWGIKPASDWAVHEWRFGHKMWQIFEGQTRPEDSDHAYGKDDTFADWANYRPVLTTEDSAYIGQPWTHHSDLDTEFGLQRNNRQGYGRYHIPTNTLRGTMGIDNEDAKGLADQMGWDFEPPTDWRFGNHEIGQYQFLRVPDNPELENGNYERPIFRGSRTPWIYDMANSIFHIGDAGDYHRAIKDHFKSELPYSDDLMHGYYMNADHYNMVSNGVTAPKGTYGSLFGGRLDASERGALEHYMANYDPYLKGEDPSIIKPDKFSQESSPDWGFDSTPVSQLSKTANIPIKIHWSDDPGTVAHDWPEFAQRRPVLLDGVGNLYVGGMGQYHREALQSHGINDDTEHGAYWPEGASNNGYNYPPGRLTWFGIRRMQPDYLQAAEQALGAHNDAKGNWDFTGSFEANVVPIKSDYTEDVGHDGGAPVIYHPESDTIFTGTPGSFHWNLENTVYDKHQIELGNDSANRGRLTPDSKGIVWYDGQDHSKQDAELGVVNQAQPGEDWYNAFKRTMNPENSWTFSNTSDDHPVMMVNGQMVHGENWSGHTENWTNEEIANADRVGRSRNGVVSWYKPLENQWSFSSWDFSPGEFQGKAIKMRDGRVIPFASSKQHIQYIKENGIPIEDVADFGTMAGGEFRSLTGQGDKGNQNWKWYQNTYKTTGPSGVVGENDPQANGGGLRTGNKNSSKANGSDGLYGLPTPRPPSHTHARRETHQWGDTTINTSTKAGHLQQLDFDSWSSLPTESESLRSIPPDLLPNGDADPSLTSGDITLPAIQRTGSSVSSITDGGTHSNHGSPRSELLALAHSVGMDSNSAHSNSEKPSVLKGIPYSNRGMIVPPEISARSWDSVSINTNRGPISEISAQFGKVVSKNVSITAKEDWEWDEYPEEYNNGDRMGEPWEYGQPGKCFMTDDGRVHAWNTDAPINNPAIGAPHHMDMAYKLGANAIKGSGWIHPDGRIEFPYLTEEPTSDEELSHIIESIPGSYQNWDSSNQDGWNFQSNYRIPKLINLDSNVEGYSHGTGDHPLVWYPKQNLLYKGPYNAYHIDLYNQIPGHVQDTGDKIGDSPIDGRLDPKTNEVSWYHMPEGHEENLEGVHKALNANPAQLGWNFSKTAEYDINGLETYKGGNGKGIIGSDGKIHIWPVDDDGFPHHGQMKVNLRSFGIPVAHTRHYIYIDDGKVYDDAGWSLEKFRPQIEAKGLTLNPDKSNWNFSKTAGWPFESSIRSPDRTEPEVVEINTPTDPSHESEDARPMIYSQKHNKIWMGSVGSAHHHIVNFVPELDYNPYNGPGLRPEGIHHGVQTNDGTFWYNQPTDEWKFANTMLTPQGFEPWHGSWGKGYITPEGEMYTWETNIEGDPHHQDVGAAIVDAQFVIVPSGNSKPRYIDLYNDTNEIQRNLLIQSFPGYKIEGVDSGWKFGRTSALLPYDINLTGGHTNENNFSAPLWEPGYWGKGFVDKDDNVIHWRSHPGNPGEPYDEMNTKPYHPFSYNRGRIYSDFYINPNGEVSSARQGYELDPIIFETDPRLRLEPKKETWTFEGNAEPNIQEVDSEVPEDQDHSLVQRRPFLYVPEHKTIYLGNQGSHHGYISQALNFRDLPVRPRIHEGWINTTHAEQSDDSDSLGGLVAWWNPPEQQQRVDVENALFMSGHAQAAAPEENKWKFSKVASIELQNGGHPIKPGWDFEGKVSNDYYHYAPTAERNRILQHGLQPARPFNSEHTWRNMPEYSKQPEGIYLTQNPAEFASNNWIMPMDLWKVPVDQIQKAYVDRKLRGKAFYIKHPVQPELHVPFENSKMGDRYWNVQVPQTEDDLNWGPIDAPKSPGYYEMADYHRQHYQGNPWGIGLPDRVIGKASAVIETLPSGRSHPGGPPFIYDSNSDTVYLGQRGDFHWDVLRKAGLGDLYPNKEGAPINPEGYYHGRVRLDYEGTPNFVDHFELHPYMDKVKDQLEDHLGTPLENLQSSWNFSKTAAHMWQPGESGKGIVNNGQVDTWNTDYNGSPHHWEMGLGNGNGFYITPDGEFNFGPYYETVSDKDIKHVERTGLQYGEDDGWEFESKVSRIEIVQPHPMGEEDEDNPSYHNETLRNRTPLWYSPDENKIYLGQKGWHHSAIFGRFENMPYSGHFGYIGPNHRWDENQGLNWYNAPDNHEEVLYTLRRHFPELRNDTQNEWSFSKVANSKTGMFGNEPISPEDMAQIKWNSEAHPGMEGKGLIDENDQLHAWHTMGGWPHHADAAQALGVNPISFLSISPQGKVDIQFTDDEEHAHNIVKDHGFEPEDGWRFGRTANGIKYFSVPVIKELLSMIPEEKKEWFMSQLSENQLRGLEGGPTPPTPTPPTPGQDYMDWVGNCPNCGASGKYVRAYGYLGSERDCRKCNHEWQVPIPEPVYPDAPAPSSTHEIFEGKYQAKPTDTDADRPGRRPWYHLPELNHTYVGQGGTSHYHLHDEFPWLDRPEYEDKLQQGYISNSTGVAGSYSPDTPDHVIRDVAQKFNVQPRFDSNLWNFEGSMKTSHSTLWTPQWPGKGLYFIPENKLYTWNTTSTLRVKGSPHHMQMWPNIPEAKNRNMLDEINSGRVQMLAIAPEGDVTDVWNGAKINPGVYEAQPELKGGPKPNEWDFTSAVPGWTHGNGKGLVDLAGNVHTWNVPYLDGQPTHTAYKIDNNVDSAWEHEFWIDPTGKISFYQGLSPIGPMKDDIINKVKAHDPRFQITDIPNGDMWNF